MRTCPLSIFVVEDQEEQRTAFVDHLKRRFPEATIEEAGSRVDAKAAILRTYAEDRPYDIAVLDLQLPEEVGGIEERDTSVAELIVKKFGARATRLLQFTAYPEDKAIQTFQLHNKIPQSGIIFEVISKRDVQWPKKMEEFINRAVAEKTVGQWLDDPFFRQMRNQSSVVIARPEAARAPVDIPAYVQALIEAWPALEPHRQYEAMATFRGTEWELTQANDGVKLASRRSAQAIADAQENARIVARLARAAGEPK